MSRLKKFTHAMVSSYVYLGVNVLYTLASVPLALKYLSKAEFGLWALTLQVAGYIALIDLGMGSSISRILIDHKDDRASGRYGGVIQSGFLVGLVQGLITLVVGLSAVWFMAGWLQVPGELSRTFLWLMIGQVFLTAATFVSRMFSQLLVAWQRIDIFNYSQIAYLVIGFGVLWMGFCLRWGVFSLLAGLIAGLLSGTATCFWACHRLGIWPKAGEWGRVSRGQFRELFSYGADLFLITLGMQLVLSSQTVLVSRQLGVEAAALWSVMTKVFSLISQVVWKIISNAMPAFAEMHVRQEHDRLWSRYRGLFIVANVFAGVCAVLFAACNAPFVSLWTQGRFSWPAGNNVLLGLWLIVFTQQCFHNGLVIFLKEIKGLKYIFLAEVFVFVGVALVILPSTGMTGMLICSLAATTLFTWLCGVWRVAGLSGIGWKPLVWDWQLPLFRILGVMVPCWLVVEWVLRGAPDWLHLAVNGGLLTVTAIWVSLRFALPADLVAEITSKLPSPLPRFAAILGGRIKPVDSA